MRQGKMILGAIAALLVVPASASGELRLRLDHASPGKIFWSGPKKTAFSFEIAGSQARDVKVQAVSRASGRVVRNWNVNGVRPGARRAVRWGGGVRRRPVGNGGYFFKVRDEDGRLADRKRSKGDRRLSVYNHRFPVRGRHTYGDGFGAGRRHRGQDIFARCGRPVRAARAGRVIHKARGPSAGRYVVISGKRTNKDYVYMHLRRGVRVKKGQRVRTGQRIARVGRSGNASGCHLHFELWSGPGWYRGGKPLRGVTRKLRRWDAWS